MDELPGGAPDLAERSPLPAYVRIEQWLTRAIGDGDLRPGDRLPREEQLAASLGVSRMTLRQALAGLDRRGTLLRKPGRDGGTFIAEPRIDVDLTGLAGFTEQLRRANLRAGARMVTASTRTARRAEVAALGLDATDEVHEVVRVRSAHRRPLALERSCFPARLFPELLERPLSGSLYALLSSVYGHRPHTAVEELEAVVAGESEARLLEVEPGSPLMRIERTASTAAGIPVEHAHDLFRPDRTRFTLRTGVGSAPTTRLEVGATTDQA